MSFNSRNWLAQHPSPILNFIYLFFKIKKNNNNKIKKIFFYCRGTQQSLLFLFREKV